jgi:hypothetical protein
MRRALLVPLLVASGLAAAGSQPLPPRAGLAHDTRECREAGDFIRNAALSRDNGMSREAFLGRLQEDLVAIRDLPESLRWFVRNAGDEAFLVGEVESVFDAPRSPELHRPNFIGRCLARPAE